jgi:lipopolysaccharide exporter
LNSISAIAHNRLGRFLGNGDSLRRQTIVGSHWLMSRGVVRSCLELVKTAVFARILFPDDYGLMALAMLAIGLLESFTSLGMEIKIQSDEEDDPGRLEVYWTLKVLRGLLLFCLAWTAAGPLSELYARPELKLIVRFLGIAFIFDGFASFGREICQREMKFARVAFVDTLCYAVVIGAGLMFLFFNRDYWALAFYSVFSSFCMMVSSFALVQCRPRFRLQGHILKGVVSFSGSILLINLLNYFFNYIDKGVIGKLLSVEQLGLYARAYYLALLPVSHIFQAIAPVILNAFRRSDNEPDRLLHAFVKTLAVFSALSLGIGIFFFWFGPIIIRVVYGEKWLAALPAFNVLIIYGASKALVSVCAPVFFIRRKPWMITAATAVMVGAFASLCYPLTAAHGTIGTAWAVVIAGVSGHVVGFILCIYLLRQPYAHTTAHSAVRPVPKAGQRSGPERSIPPAVVPPPHPAGGKTNG